MHYIDYGTGAGNEWINTDDRTVWDLGAEARRVCPYWDTLPQDTRDTIITAAKGADMDTYMRPADCIDVTIKRIMGV